MKTILAFFAFVLAAFGQTTAPDFTRQLRAPADPSAATARVLIVKADGSVSFAILGAGFELDVSGPIPVLKPSIPVLPLPPQEIRITAVAGPIPSQFYDLNHDNVPTARVKVYKNGLLQMEGVSQDYQIIGRRVTFNAGSVPRSEVTAGDYIQILYTI